MVRCQVRRTVGQWGALEESTLITITCGDILHTEAHYIAHGVATGSQEGLGTGLALNISSTWPDAQRAFKRFTRHHKFEGGDVYVVPPAEGHPGVIYVATQPDMRHADLHFLNRGLRNLARYCDRREVESVALPPIAAGLGKLDWEAVVKPLLLYHRGHSRTTFHVYEDFRLEYERETKLEDR